MPGSGIPAGSSLRSTAHGTSTPETPIPRVPGAAADDLLGRVLQADHGRAHHSLGPVRPHRPAGGRRTLRAAALPAAEASFRCCDTAVDGPRGGGAHGGAV
ncbi:hypothetical protein Acsp04_26960 [Actinomadura sp. NBRC 104425]|nr:hypothetical protein Acsp04_26960 [Actinomadura sp. NBRC 104425]